MGVLTIPLRLPFSIHITDADSNILRIGQVALDQTSLQVFDKRGVQLCSALIVIVMGQSVAEQNARLVANGVSADLLKSLGEVSEKIDAWRRGQATPLTRIIEIAKLVTVGEPMMVKPGDIPNICKPISIAL